MLDIERSPGLLSDEMSPHALFVAGWPDPQNRLLFISDTFSIAEDGLLKGDPRQLEAFVFHSRGADLRLLLPVHHRAPQSRGRSLLVQSRWSRRSSRDAPACYPC